MESKQRQMSDSQNKSLRSHQSVDQSIENEGDEVELHQPQRLESDSMERNKFLSCWDSLVKLLQLTVVFILFIFIFIMGYLIFVQLNQFWFSSSKDNTLGKLMDSDQPNESKINTPHNQDENELNIENKQQQMEQALKGDQNDPQPLSNPQSRNKLIQQIKETAQPSSISQAKSNNKNSLSPQNSDLPPQTNQLYDPVLIQLNRYRNRYGRGYKQSIYTMKNTSITQDQYLRAKNLIQLTQFYDPKQKKFIVQKNTVDGNCGQSDPRCEKKQKYIESIVAQQISYYEQKYRERFGSLKQQLPFCIIVPSYKNNQGKNIQRNLNSIFQQQYDKFHVVYIDDASKDGTPEVVKGYAKNYQIDESRLLFIENSQNQKALKNIFMAAHEYCKQKEIMIIVDGDDYLIGTQVLRFLNFQYQTKHLLASYTNYLRINQPYYIKVGTSTPYLKNILNHRAFRRTPKMFRASHLRSYYVDLFRKIKAEDLKDEKGQFFTAANDFAIMMPVMEMAAPHVDYLPQLTYLYDSGTGLNNFQSKKEIQERNVKIVSRRKAYSQVEVHEFYPTIEY